jgi:hypothetical protein
MLRRRNQGFNSRNFVVFQKLQIIFVVFVFRNSLMAL